MRVSCTRNGVCYIELDKFYSLVGDLYLPVFSSNLLIVCQTVSVKLYVNSMRNIEYSTYGLVFLNATVQCTQVFDFIIIIFNVMQHYTLVSLKLSHDLILPQSNLHHVGILLSEWLQKGTCWSYAIPTRYGEEGAQRTTD